MISKKAIAWGCAIAALLCLVGIGAVVLFVMYVAQDVKGVGVFVEAPTDVVVGQTFEMAVVVTNERPKKALALSDIDIDENYLDAFTVASIEPRPKSSMHVPIDNSRSFTFDTSIPPLSAKTFVFKLQAQKPGIYRGDVDVCEGARFITTMAQTSIKAKE